MRWPDHVLAANLVPHAADLAALASVIAAVVAMMLVGRAAARGRCLPEMHLFAGWGVVCLVLTLWGIVVPWSMTLPALALLVVAVLVLAVPSLRPWRADWVALGRVLAIALPVLVIMAPVRISQPDSYLNLLPNAAYLYEYGMFPANGRPPSFSFLPGAPFNTQLAAFLGGFLLPDFPANGMVLFNVVLQVGFALLVARTLEPDPEARRWPSWTSCAAGLLLTTALNPGFTPQISFSDYGEAPSAVMLGGAAWAAVAVLTRLAGNRPARIEITILALVLAGLVNVKQQSPALVVAVAVTAIALGAVDRRIGWRPALRWIGLATLPAILLLLAWKLYVFGHLDPSAELEVLPPHLWRPDLLPAILAAMGQEMVEKFYFFASSFIAIGLFLARWRRGARDEATWLLGFFTGAFLVDNVFLLFVYVAHSVPMGYDLAHSYFRYSAQLSLLLVLALAATAREWWRARPRAPAQGWRRAVPAATIAAMLLAPLGFADRLRYDLQMPQPVYWDYARQVAARLDENDRLALVLPGDNGSVASMMRAVIRWTTPHRGVDIRIEKRATPETLAELAAAGYDRALVTCAPPGFAGLASGGAFFLEHAAAEWVAEPIVSPSWRPRDRWTRIVSWEPLCE